MSNEKGGGGLMMKRGVSGMEKGGVFGCGKLARNDDGGYEATY